MAAPDEGPTPEPDHGLSQAPNQNSNQKNQTTDHEPNQTLNQTLDQELNQTATQSSNHGSTSDSNQDPAGFLRRPIDPNFPIRDVDLSDPTFTSDGQAQELQTDDISYYLHHLSWEFRLPGYAATLGFTAKFIGGLPQGYLQELRLRHVPAEQRIYHDFYVHGHPSGGSYRLWTDFARHVFHIMRNDLANCDCSLC